MGELSKRSIKQSPKIAKVKKSSNASLKNDNCPLFNFKCQVSKHIVTLLNPYFKSNVPLGKITNSADFKHLARTFTHQIVNKEVEKSGFSSLLFDEKIKKNIS